MKRLILLAVLCATTAQPTVDCRNTLPDYWNPFADAATAYRDRLIAGVKDLKLQRKMFNKWEDLNGCGCF